MTREKALAYLAGRPGAVMCGDWLACMVKVTADDEACATALGLTSLVSRFRDEEYIRVCDMLPDERIAWILAKQLRGEVV